MKKLLAKIILLLVSLTMIVGCSTSSESTSQNTLTAPESDLELYYAAREVATNMALYDEETMNDLQDALMTFDLTFTIDENIEKISNPDEETTEALTVLRDAYNAVIQLDEEETVVYDIYEGKDLPVMGTEMDNDSTSLACLTDDADYRPVLNSYLLDDPSSAIGTIICIPSVRGHYSETRNYADIFNEKGYNVLALEPRFSKVEEDDGTYYLMNLDCIRAIRYVKYYAEDLGIDPDRIIVIGGSKGNYAHMMSTLYFDLTPTEYAEQMNVSINDYEDDEIDQVQANVAVQVWSYGNLYAVDDDGELTLDDMGVYSEENYNNGISLPAMLFLGGTYDTMVTSLMPTVMNALIEFNNNEDKLYEIQWEVHEFDGVPHGFGAGTSYDNVMAYWDEADAFFQKILNASESE